MGVRSQVPTPALRSSRDVDHASILRVSLSLHETVPFELVDQAGYVRGTDAKRVCEFALRRAPPLQSGVEGHVRKQRNTPHSERCSEGGHGSHDHAAHLPDGLLDELDTLLGRHESGTVSPGTLKKVTHRTIQQKIV
jgi:hypothetical protein